MRVEAAPALTLTDGHAAIHQSVVGDRLRLALDADLSRAVTGASSRLAHPALVWDVAIGQSTVLTRRVIANLFYRGLVFQRAPLIGDTLHTTTEVVALRQNRARAGRPASGLAVLRVNTVDQRGRAVLDFWRCAMLPLADPHGQTDLHDDLDSIPSALNRATLGDAVHGWRLDRFGEARDRFRFADVEAGSIWAVPNGDVVTSAPELARLTLNVAGAHHDAGHNARRLVYGGHTIGLAAGQVTQIFPDLVTIVAWHSCDHTAPVYEGDTLATEVSLERAEPLPDGGGLVHLRARVTARRVEGGETAQVLDWRLVAVMA